MKEHCCMGIENRLEAACCATNPRPSGLVALAVAESRSRKAAKATFVALRSTESRQSYSRRSWCWQNDIDTACCCHRVIHAAGKRHADLRREAASVISAKPASGLMYDSAVWYLVWVCGRVRVRFVEG